MASPLPLERIVIRYRAFVASKRNSLFSETLFWVVSLPQSSGSGDKVCGYWMHFLGGGTAGRSHSPLGSVLIRVWMRKASSAGACITSLHFTSEEYSSPKQIFGSSENFAVIKIAWNKRSHACSQGPHFLQELSSVLITAEKIHESCRNELMILSRQRFSCRDEIGLNVHPQSVLCLQCQKLNHKPEKKKKITLRVELGIQVVCNNRLCWSPRTPWLSSSPLVVGGWVWCGSPCHCPTICMVPASFPGTQPRGEGKPQNCG